MGIEFVDRYGGHTPSSLRGCRGQCEAMGYVPINRGEGREPWASLWREAEAKSPTDAGWHFVRCPECNGTGRVSAIRSVLRIPLWALKSLRQTWQFTMNPDYFLGDSGFWGRLKTSLYICFWLDIARLKN